MKELQNLLLDLLDKILRPVKISPVLNKPLRRITIDTEKPSTSIFNEENSERNSPIITHPFSIDIQRVGEKVSLFFSRLEDKLVFDFATGLAHSPINLIQKCQRQDCGGYFLKGTKRGKRFALNGVLGLWLLEGVGGCSLKWRKESGENIIEER